MTPIPWIPVIVRVCLCFILPLPSSFSPCRGFTELKSRFDGYFVWGKNFLLRRSLLAMTYSNHQGDRQYNIKLMRGLLQLSSFYFCLMIFVDESVVDRYLLFLTSQFLRLGYYIFSPLSYACLYSYVNTDFQKGETNQ